MTWQPTDIPCGFESAVFKLDMMNKRDKFGPCSIFTSGDGHPTIKRYNEDGTNTTITLINGHWHYGVNVE